MFFKKQKTKMLQLLKARLDAAYGSFPDVVITPIKNGFKVEYKMNDLLLCTEFLVEKQ